MNLIFFRDTWELCKCVTLRYKLQLDIILSIIYSAAVPSKSVLFLQELCYLWHIYVELGQGHLQICFGRPVLQLVLEN